MRLVPIVCQPRDAVKRFIEESGLPFDVLVDETREVARQYDVWQRLGLTAWNLARPAVFLIGRDGRLRFTWVSDNQREFPTSQALIDAVDRGP